jgi:uncharacterized protein
METETDSASEIETASAANVDREAEFNRGLEAYRTLHHFDAHDIWTLVYQCEQNETTRRFLQALIQVANAMHKVRHNAELRGALHLLERALIKLDELPDRYGGIDLATFRDATRSCLAEVARLLSIKSIDLAESYIPPLNVVERGPMLERRTVPQGADPDKLLADGFDAYHNGRYFDAHELWEESRRPRPEGPVRNALTGLILIATAMHKLYRAKSPDSAAQLLELALDKLRETPEGTLGLAVTDLVKNVERIIGELEQVAVYSSAQIDVRIDPGYVLQIRMAS